MQGERRSARVDESGPELEARARAVPEASPQLDGDGKVDGVRHGLDDAARERLIFQERRACARSRHLAHRAAEVEIDEVGAYCLDHLRGVREGAWFGAEELNCERMLVGGDPEVPECPLVSVLDSGAADHLRADEPGPVAASLAPKRLHADSRHRREHEPRRHLDRADAPRCTKIDHRGNRRSRVLTLA